MSTGKLETDSTSQNTALLTASKSITKSRFLRCPIVFMLMLLMQQGTVEGSGVDIVSNGTDV